jgi:alkyl sulfatase BDS1-like metallo-beta-lactamase superfamily hydrolase
MDWQFTDLGERYRVEIGNSVMRTTRVAATAGAAADLSLQLDRATLDDITLGRTDMAAAVAAGRIRVSGNAALLQEWLSWLDRFPADFPIVTPRP